MTRRSLTLTLVAAAVLAAAILAVALTRGGDDDAAPPPAAPTGGATGTMLAPVPNGKIGAGGLTIAEALTAETPEALLVRGYLVEDGGALRLCDTLEGGCGEPALAIEGEPGVEPGSAEPVTVLGKLEGTTLEVVDLSRA
jgi:hypothetical protein